MLKALDVHYDPDGAGCRAALLGFEAWESARGHEALVVELDEVAPYVPGEFYRRELPALLAVLGASHSATDVIVVDGQVWLDAAQAPGLGARLHDAVGGGIPVVGVAKNPFRGAEGTTAVYRGESRRGLYVSAVGMPLDEAVAGVQRMHGAHRIPTLLRDVDHLARGMLAPADVSL